MNSRTTLSDTDFVMKPVVLITGGTGQLGSALGRAADPSWKTIVWNRSDVDLADPQALSTRLEELSPNIILNAAAYTQVDRAEEEVALANAVNADAPKTLANWAARSGALLIHYSTDYVYDGSGGTPWQEDADIAPLNAYGRSKAAGDQAVLDSGARGAVLRTSWVYSALGKCFFSTILKLARERAELRCVADQIGAPTSAAWLAETSMELLAKMRADPQFPAMSILHAAPSGETSWHGFAKEAVAQVRAAGLPLAVQQIDKIETKDWPSPATRPANSRLDTTRLSMLLGKSIPDWRVLVQQEARIFADTHTAREQVL